MVKKNKTKGIILAGGTGSRLHPLTISISKQLMPIYDKPMIYYPLSVLMLCGIRDILIITSPEHSSSFIKLLGDGNQIGCNICYAEQSIPNGLAQAFIIGEHFIDNDNVTMILGDNIFYSSDLKNKLESSLNPNGANIFAYEVQDPHRYGVVEFDSNNRVISVEEKPKKPKSNYAIPGLYFYDNKVIDIAKNLTPSSRGEYEISDINTSYLKQNKLFVTTLSRGTAWLDTGTFNSLHDASQFIKVIENRQALKIGCIEEIAYRMKFINKEELLKSASKYLSSGYGKYLIEISKLNF